MEGQKQFLIGANRDSTSVSVDSSLGLILRRPEVRDIAAEYGSEVRGSSGFNYIDIVPPIPKKELGKLGQALVDLAIRLDPSEPRSTYRIS